MLNDRRETGRKYAEWICNGPLMADVSGHRRNMRRRSGINSSLQHSLKSLPNHQSESLFLLRMQEEQDSRMSKPLRKKQEIHS